MRIETDPKLDFDDVLVQPKRSVLGSRKEVGLEREFTFKHSKVHYRGIPIIASNMNTIGTLRMADALRDFQLGTALHKHYSVREISDYIARVEFLMDEYEFPAAENVFEGPVFYSMGILPQDLTKLKQVEEQLKERGANLRYICVDVANGYSERFVDFIKKLRDDNPDKTILAGNVVTGEMTEQLILSGADIVKVGIGPGSVCTTRKMTGVGYPQLSAIIECMDAAHGLGGLVCADGGCRVPGDIAKAFGAGADFVMLGSMLAGHDECDGELVYENPPCKVTTEQEANRLGLNQYIDVTTRFAYKRSFGCWIQYDDMLTPTGMKFYGMSSSTAMNKYAGGVADYRASEGKEVIVPYKGSVKDTVQQILGGLRSTCTYTGARTLKDLSKCTTFVQVNRQLNTVFGND